MILRLLGKPCLVRHIKLHLPKINVENLQSEHRNKVFRERSVLLLHRARELSWVSEAVEVMFELPQPGNGT